MHLSLTVCAAAFVSAAHAFCYVCLSKDFSGFWDGGTTVVFMIQPRFRYPAIVSETDNAVPKRCQRNEKTDAFYALDVEASYSIEMLLGGSILGIY